MNQNDVVELLHKNTHWSLCDKFCSIFTLYKKVGSESLVNLLKVTKRQETKRNEKNKNKLY